MTLRAPLVVTRSLRLTGEQIVTWRKLQGLTAEQVAERAGISRNTLRSIEQ
ncbi:MAG: helix-turn-helix domain-containing protein, partial [Actinomycetota bacterium]|nr:helix-turn-helix domain-containing protein [Actinomycetota bacterium]